MFSAKDFQDLDNTGGKKMTPSIYTKCKLTSVEVGDNYIDFNYENQDGAIANKRAWFPELNKLKATEEKTIVEVLKEAEEATFGHIVRHLRIFLTPDELNVFPAAPDLRTAAVKAASLLNSVKDREHVNIKLIYDKDGQWSRFPDRSYIEKYVEGEEPTLKYTKWELENRMTKKSSPVENNDGPLLY